MSSKEVILKEVDKLSLEMKSVAKFIGQYPELAFSEFKAQEKLTWFLKKYGFNVKKGVGGIKTAFIATKSNRFKKTPNLGFLAEYDALPGIGHACGHNLIGTASSGAAIALSSILKQVSGTITVIGCPAEEGGGGKVLLAKKGIFDPLSVAMMAHPDNKTEVVKYMLALIEVDIEFLGRASHAAAEPEKGIHALNAAVATYSAILKMSKTLTKDARVHGIFTSGGQKPNIIPAHAALSYYVRALDMKYAYQIIQKIKKIAFQEAKKIKAKVIFKVNPIVYEPFHPNRTLAHVFEKQLAFLKIKNEQSDPKSKIGSSDIGNVGNIVPTIHYHSHFY